VHSEATSSHAPRLAVIWTGPGAEQKIAGLGSIERLVLTARAAGIESCLILTAAGLRDEDVARLREEPAVLLLHAELALDPGYLVRLVEASLGTKQEATVGIASGPTPVHPFACGVRVSAGGVDAVDPRSTVHAIGAAIVPGRFAAALVGDRERAGSAWQRYLSQTSCEGAVAAVDVGYPPVVTTARERRRAEWRMVRAVAKASDGAVARVFNRRISAVVTAVLVHTPVTPNAFTFFTLTLGLATAVVLLGGDHRHFLWGTFLYELNIILDGCDGELARLKFQESRFGAWLDTIVDQVTNLSFFIAVPFGLARRADGHIHLWLGLFAVGSVVLLLPVVYWRSRQVNDDAHFNDFGASVVRALPPGSVAARIVNIAAAQLRRDAYGLTFFFFSVLGGDALISYGFALGMALHYPAVLLPLARRPSAALSTTSSLPANP
jgi:phosphatidylglycerophosphate synthase